MGSLSELYALMEQLATMRRALVPHADTVHGNRGSLADGPAALERIRDQILSWPRHNGSFVLRAGDAGDIVTGLDYELTELERDIVFLRDGESALLRLLVRQRPRFSAQVEELSRRLSAFFESENPRAGTAGASAAEGHHGAVRGRVAVDTFVTDRDGTVNNYCGRYRSSVQAIYNAVFLSRFAWRCCRRSVMLSSAPLCNGGLVDVSVNPDGVFVYAGSKGREFCDERGRYRAFPIDDQRKQLLDQFNLRLEQLLDHSEYGVFRLIGSSLQFKFGQTTVARQDVDNSVSDRVSGRFLDEVNRLVTEVDPRREYLRVEDTGKDIEVILTVKDGSDAKDFDKGDGLTFVAGELGLELDNSRTLICGDTSSDIPMARIAAQRSRDSLAVFVGADDRLSAAVRSANANASFASCPDVLVTALGGLEGSAGRDGNEL
ncbi:MAG: trehalose 6-phosphate synthase [Spirochaetaceae bacterium]|nr:MAG: trehalose 6-phosphate synthase [Spirochaetaceae bacterium]